MATLAGTPFALAYSLFGVTNDIDLISRMTSIMILSGVGILIYHLKYSPPKYGKLGKDKRISEGSAGLNLTIPSRTGWTFSVLPSFLIPILLILTTPGKEFRNFNNLTATVLFTFHYFNKSVIYPRQISKAAKPMELWNFFLFLFGISYNSFLQGHHLVNVHKSTTSMGSYFGLGIFIVGMLINIYHDKLLTSLRNNSSDTKSKATVYKIPRGGLFEYVSCANFFGEIVEWCGLAILTQGLPQVLLALLTMMVTGFRAVESHKFYKKTFPNYPKNRKILIPFIF